MNMENIDIKLSEIPELLNLINSMPSNLLTMPFTISKFIKTVYTKDNKPSHATVENDLNVLVNEGYLSKTIDSRKNIVYTLVRKL